MLGRAIWDKLSEHIFANFEIAQVERRVIYPKNHPKHVITG